MYCSVSVAASFMMIFDLSISACNCESRLQAIVVYSMDSSSSSISSAPSKVSSSVTVSSNQPVLPVECQVQLPAELPEQKQNLL